MHTHVLLDLTCLERGLPPLSSDANDVVDMILRSNPIERRRINRKIRKLCKTAMKHNRSEATYMRPQEMTAHQESILKYLGLKQNKKYFDRHVLRRRIEYVRRFMMRVSQHLNL